MENQVDAIEVLEPESVPELLIGHYLPPAEDYMREPDPEVFEIEGLKFIYGFLEGKIRTYVNAKGLSCRNCRAGVIKILGRNDRCPCGSGLKVKKCCSEFDTYKYHQVMREISFSGREKPAEIPKPAMTPGRLAGLSALAGIGMGLSFGLMPHSLTAPGSFQRRRV